MLCHSHACKLVCNSWMQYTMFFLGYYSLNLWLALLCWLICVFNCKTVCFFCLTNNLYRNPPQVLTQESEMHWCHDLYVIFLLVKYCGCHIKTFYGIFLWNIIYGKCLNWSTEQTLHFNSIAAHFPLIVFRDLVYGSSLTRTKNPITEEKKKTLPITCNGCTL